MHALAAWVEQRGLVGLVENESHEHVRGDAKEDANTDDHDIHFAFQALEKARGEAAGDAAKAEQAQADVKNTFDALAQKLEVK